MKQDIIQLGSTCNQKCLFCNQEETFDIKTKAAILLKLVSFKKADVERVITSGGEPTLFREQLEFIISTPKRLGFKEIEIQSNAALLSSLKYTQKLKNLGLAQAMMLLYAFCNEIIAIKW